MQSLLQGRAQFSAKNEGLYYPSQWREMDIKIQPAISATCSNTIYPEGI